MLVKTVDMPDQGKLSPLVEMVNIEPLTFGELLKYLGDEQLTPAREYIRSLNYLVNIDPNIGNLSILNADYILYVFKALSASKETKLVLSCKCEHCGKTHNHKMMLNEIEFKDVAEEAMKVKSVKLIDDHIKIKYPTINEFIKFVGRLGRYQENINIDTLKLASMLDVQVESSAVTIISNCRQEDIALINCLDNMWFKLVVPVPIPCPDNLDKRGTTATFSMSAVDIFLDIVQLNPITGDQILFGETR